MIFIKSQKLNTNLQMPQNNIQQSFQLDFFVVSEPNTSQRTKYLKKKLILQKWNREINIIILVFLSWLEFKYLFRIRIEAYYIGEMFCQNKQRPCQILNALLTL